MADKGRLLETLRSVIDGIFTVITSCFTCIHEAFKAAGMLALTCLLMLRRKTRLSVVEKHIFTVGKGTSVNVIFTIRVSRINRPSFTLAFEGQC